MNRAFIKLTDQHVSTYTIMCDNVTKILIFKIILNNGNSAQTTIGRFFGRNTITTVLFILHDSSLVVKDC